MAVNDRILEAEQSLQDIARELKRMRDAARLLEASQKKADSVIGSAERLVEKVEQFAAICRSITPAETIARLDSLHADVAQLASLVRASKNDVRGTVTDVELRVIEIENRVQSLAESSKLEELTNLTKEIKNVALSVGTDVESGFSELDKRFQEFAESSKRQQAITLLLIVATLLVVTGTLVHSIILG